MVVFKDWSDGDVLTAEDLKNGFLKILGFASGTTSTVINVNKSDSQVMIVAKGNIYQSNVLYDWNANVSLQDITQAGTTTLDTTRVGGIGDGGSEKDDFSGFSLIYLGSLSSEAHTISVTTSGGSLQNVKIMAIEFRNI